MSPIEAGILGLAVGDALGVPVEFSSRAALDNSPVTSMIAFYLRAHHGRVLTDEGVEIIHNISSLTHAHPRSLVACVAYCTIAENILKGFRLDYAIEDGLKQTAKYYRDKPRYSAELAHFKCMTFDNDGYPSIKPFRELPREMIRSSGYVVDTLDASLWCLLNYEGYAETVLAAVNLGSDTDTTAAVCGGLAGLYYSQDHLPDETRIPQQWIESLVNLPLIEEVCTRLEKALYCVRGGEEGIIVSQLVHQQIEAEKKLSVN